MIALDQAIETLLRQASPVSRVETVATLDALGRVLAEPVVSGIAVPPLDNSEMDGYAVRSADLTHVPASLPVSQRIQAGQVGQPLAAGSAARIFTGAPIPAGCDAIVPQEATQLQADRVVVLAMPTPGQWIRPAGMDIAAGAKVLARGTRLRPPHVGLAASVGLANLTVYRRLKVGVLFTGDELAMPGDPLPEGRIYNSNRFLLSALLRGLGCEVIDLGIVPDRLEPTRQALVRAAEQADLLSESLTLELKVKAQGSNVIEAVQALLNIFEKDPADARIDSYGRLLYGQAVIAEGSIVQDPAAFAKRINELIARDATRSAE